MTLLAPKAVEGSLVLGDCWWRGVGVSGAWGAVGGCSLGCDHGVGTGEQRAVAPSSGAVAMGLFVRAGRTEWLGGGGQVDLHAQLPDVVKTLDVMYNLSLRRVRRNAQIWPGRSPTCTPGGVRAAGSGRRGSQEQIGKDVPFGAPTGHLNGFTSWGGCRCPVDGIGGCTDLHSAGFSRLRRPCCC